VPRVSRAVAALQIELCHSIVIFQAADTTTQDTNAKPRMTLTRMKLWFSLNRSWLAKLIGISLRAPVDVSALKDITLTQTWGLWGDRSQNPLTATPRSYWSQSDEDGIIEEIARRINLPDRPTFIEFGVDDGTECNTVALLANGWNGCWVGGQKIRLDTSSSRRLLYLRDWITRENIGSHVERALDFLGTSQVNFCSMDLDGNDFHFVKQMLENGFSPDVWACEYNGSLPLGSKWVMPYRADHTWKRGSDYFGASFSAFKDLFTEHGYSIVATSVTGINMFLVRNVHLSAFSDVPLDDERIFRPSLPFLVTRKPFRRTTEIIQSLIE
jgi:hypothetical protein